MSLDTRPEDASPVRSIDDLLPYFRSAEKPATALQIGIEHEKTAVLEDSFEAVPYEGRRSIRELLVRARRFGYEPVLDHGNQIAGIAGMETLSLEPGGQVELSGSPFRTLAEVSDEHLHHVARMKAIAAELGIRLLGIGYRPFGTLEQMPWMPKTRYKVMRSFMPTRGSHALHMMLMTGTVQTSLDFTSEEDCADKVRAAGSISSLVAALYANSPIVAGRDTGMQTFRYRVWDDVDPARCGLLPFFFDDEGFTYRRYLEWALQAPMLFIRRSGEYVTMDGISFAQFMAQGHRGHTATFTDFEDHMTTLFPEIRVKQVIEMRSADAADVAISNALPALFMGILYDRGEREAATALTDGLSFEQRIRLQRDVANEGLRARIGESGRTVQEASRELVGLARRGLERIGFGDDARFLDPLAEIAESGRSPADRLREAYARGGPAALVQAAAL